jgi:ankyrin repeat protein
MKRFISACAIAFAVLLPNVCGAQSFELLLKSVEAGDVPKVESLLNQGLDANTADLQGNSLLMIAARVGQRDMAAFLISRKASVTRRSPFGDTALMFASLKGHLPIVRLLVDNGAEVSHSGWTPLHYAAVEGHAEIVKYLLEKGADKNAVAPNGYTPLMLASLNGKLEAARMLLYEDADVSVRGPKGETALVIAKGKNNPELISLLRRAGAVD